MNGCRQCPAFGKCTVAVYRGSACAALRSTYGVESDPEIYTNADRIRAISDEELAENRCVEIKGLYPWPIFVAFDVPEKRFLSWESAVAEELNWLQQPAEEG